MNLTHTYLTALASFEDSDTLERVQEALDALIPTLKRKYLKTIRGFQHQACTLFGKRPSIALFIRDCEMQDCSPKDIAANYIQAALDNS